MDAMLGGDFAPGKGKGGKGGWGSGEGKLKKGQTRDQSRIFWKVFDGRFKSGEVEQIAMSRRQVTEGSTEPLHEAKVQAGSSIASTPYHPRPKSPCIKGHLNNIQK